ncbi:MAG: hypothetical protein HY851_12370 [candidate division Zixibacteria bacterium]|nr:hypothetical protein [candidate division Zixibacteria bacterium]
MFVCRIKLFLCTSALVVALGVCADTTAQALSQRQSQFAFDDRKDEFGEANAKPSPDSTKASAKPKKSMWKAAGLSALVPGAGQYYLGHRQKARAFFGVETAGWIGFASFQIYSHWKKDDLIRFARERANARLDGKSDEFLDLVGFYPSIRDYNNLGRVYDPERPYLDDSPDNHWQWQTEEDRTAYRTIKNRSREAHRRAQFMIGAVIVNRIVSVIDAVRSARQKERTIDETFSSVNESRVHLTFDPNSDRQQVRLSITTNW